MKVFFQQHHGQRLALPPPPARRPTLTKTVERENGAVALSALAEPRKREERAETPFQRREREKKKDGV